MSQTEQPQVYLISPPAFDLGSFPDKLAAVLDAHPVSCLRLALGTRDEDRISRAADACREVAHERDVAIVVNDLTALSERLGLDGVHLSDATKSVRAARKELGPDAIVGSFSGASFHNGLEAGEAGADYIAFGPVAGSGAVADHDLFARWTEMIEVPVVAEGALTLELVRGLSPVTDFFGIGEEIWETDDAAATLGALINAMT
jgi:thiamine-phosphate pyrophosphorylase